jgi:DNA-binding MarR family transcriptional regulator
MHHAPGASGSPHIPVSDPTAAAVFSAFMRTSHAHRQLMARKMATYGVHPSQMFCLRAIAHSDGITQRDLAEQLSIARPTLTVMVQKMERAGLVERASDSTDQRFTRIHLSAQGRSLHEAMHEIMAEVITEMTSGLSEPDSLELARLLALLGDSMTTALEKPEQAQP